MSATATREVTASCPGKVLILGGYCVLERPNPGLVLAVDARFRCKASLMETEGCQIWLTSPQWGSQGWSGKYQFDNGQLVPLASNSESNAYIERTVSWTLQQLQLEGKFPPPAFGGIKLEMGGDNDFYSQLGNLALLGLPRTKQGLTKLPKQTQVRDKGAKTGLGSSAAMISCIVSALVALLWPGSGHEQYAHRLAQMCHAAVQGKIGSGFDVCAAFFGSMQYVRYDASPVPAQCLGVMGNAAEGSAQLQRCVKADSVWNESVTGFHLPPGIELLCAEVEDSGSETPSMSKKILEWKAANPAHRIWTGLIESNSQASQALQAIAQYHEADPAGYSQELNQLSQLPGSGWDSTSKFALCASAFARVRGSLRALGGAAGVPVEPESQQLLCDATLRVPGVMVCGVPGAGGNDAIYALALGPEAAKRVEAFWERYQPVQVCPLLLRESRNGGGVELS
ncbi:phosphomevalonate kinase [Batrachochytrium salamandrivorans]|nr:phosphomevalonate kinase [Batrachochytrium salamandrivorans]